MARKNAAVVTDLETVENNGMAEETGGTGETIGTGENSGQTSEERIQLVYIGPSLTFEKLRTSQILLGTQEEIDGFMAPIVEKYPEAVHLLVTPDKLPEALEKTGSKTSILHKYYEDMLAKSRDIRKG